MAEPNAAKKSAATFEDATLFAASLPGNRPLIGIDAGTKTLGLALSDVTRTIASPLDTIRRTKFTTDMALLTRYVEEHNVSGFVLGLPTNLDGSEGPRVQSTRALAANINKILPLPILFWDERLSTVAAERVLLDADASRERRSQVIDKIAATIILQSALDRLQRINERKL